MNAASFRGKSAGDRARILAESRESLRRHKQSRLRKILLLQGPVGPFFSELQHALSGLDVSVRRVIFSAGDQLFAPRNGCIRFSGTLAEWETWLRFEMTRNAPDVIVLFGSSRPAHEVARHLANEFGVDVVSLEEGYLRSGYVSCEVGGNNQHSPLSRWTFREPASAVSDAPPAVAGLRLPFVTMTALAAIHYVMRDLFSKETDDPLFHRPRERVVPLAWKWAGHMLRRIVARLSEFPTRLRLHRNPGYLLVPLQVASDSQLTNASRGWTTTTLIDACLEAVSASGCNQRLIFKLHPLECDSKAIKRLIRIKMMQHGVARQHVAILHSGRMSDLTRHSSGMIVINSTSAFSALHHNVPVLVLGDAVFRHKEIVTLGDFRSDIAAFFKLRHPKSQRLIAAFLADLKSESLVPGDFYVASGRRAAIGHIVKLLESIEGDADAYKEASR